MKGRSLPAQPLREHERSALRSARGSRQQATADHFAGGDRLQAMHGEEVQQLIVALDRRVEMH